jgi:hypothetical protein
MLVRTSGIFAFLITLSFFLQGCKKDTPPTVVKATVVDMYTQEPLPGVCTFVHKWHETEKKYVLFTVLYTDENGFMEFGNEENPDFTFREMHKTGYVVKDNTIYDSFVNFEKGKINEGVIPLIPLDSWLNLRVDKVTPGTSKIYLSVYSPILKNEIGASQGRVPLMRSELELSEGQSYAQFPAVASNEMLSIHWDFKPLTPWSPFTTPFSDSVFVTRGDTSAINISY